MGRATSNVFWPPRRGQKVKYHLISIHVNRVNFKDFLYQTLCVFSQMKEIQNISDGIIILSPGSCPRGETLGHWGCPGGHFFSKYGHVVSQIDGNDEKNRMQVKLLS